MVPHGAGTMMMSHYCGLHAQHKVEEPVSSLWVLKTHKLVMTLCDSNQHQPLMLDVADAVGYLKMWQTLLET